METIREVAKQEQVKAEAKYGDKALPTVAVKKFLDATEPYEDQDQVALDTVQSSPIAAAAEIKKIEHFIATRKAFIDRVRKIFVKGKDYHRITVKRKNKKTNQYTEEEIDVMAKGGAEKIASIFQWQAEFIRDVESLEMFGNPKGLVAYVCNLTKNKKFIGQGRGSSDLAGNYGDANKTMKMAQKSAFIDAVLRASGLSDFFTQDLEDMPKERINQEPQTVISAKPTKKQLEYIGILAKGKGLTKETLDAMMKEKGFNVADAKGASQVIEYLLGETK